MAKTGHELWILLKRIKKLSGENVFFWRINQDLSTPPEEMLFPPTLKKTLEGSNALSD
jgi:hypothetical protein